MSALNLQSLTTIPAPAHRLARMVAGLIAVTMPLSLPAPADPDARADVRPGHAERPAAPPGRTVTLPTDNGHTLFIPDGYRPGDEGVALLVHFHGSPAVINRNAAEARLDAAIVHVNYRGLSSVYRQPFSDPELFGRVLDAALAALGEQPEIPQDPPLNRLCVSSFSAGYGAVREILKQPNYVDRIDGLLLADSLYASFTGPDDPSPRDEQMAPFRDFAARAARGSKVMIVTHSRVATPTYASTVRTADDLIEHVHAAVEAIDTPNADNAPLRFDRHAAKGRFAVWGVEGDDGQAHLAHLRHIGHWLGHLPIARRLDHQPDPRESGSPADPDEPGPAPSRSVE